MVALTSSLTSRWVISKGQVREQAGGRKGEKGEKLGNKIGQTMLRACINVTQ